MNDIDIPGCLLGENTYSIIARRACMSTPSRRYELMAILRRPRGREIRPAEKIRYPARSVT
jgi:hypothetical protein